MAQLSSCKVSNICLQVMGRTRTLQDREVIHNVADFYQIVVSCDLFSVPIVAKHINDPLPEDANCLFQLSVHV